MEGNGDTTTTTQVSPLNTRQVTPLTTTQVRPLTTTQVSPLTTRQIAPLSNSSNLSALMSLLDSQQKAPQNITPQELAKIGYFYDVGGEDIFAPVEHKKQDKKQEAQDPYKQFYATGGTVDDLFRILRN